MYAIFSVGDGLAALQFPPFFSPLEGDFSASGTKVKLCDSLFVVSGHVAARVLTGAIVIPNFCLVGWG